MSIDSITEPIPISLIAGRYLLFDINVVTYLRRTHHICGVLIGGLPQVPQQNIFTGLPVELLPEEARLLVEKEVAYIIDDSTWHRQRLGTLRNVDRKQYVESLKAEGLKARRAAEDMSKRKSQHALAKKAAKRAGGASLTSLSGETEVNTTGDEAVVESDSIFNDERPLSRSSLTASTSGGNYSITPTTSYAPSSLPQNSSQQSEPPVPSSYPLFKYLHSRKYFLTPGLRFGCDYTVYPGDPLRFHSHFLAVGYEWNKGIPMLDIVGGGRLGTGVKKGFLIGGEDPEDKSEGEGKKVRTFCIEWGGM